PNGAGEGRVGVSGQKDPQSQAVPDSAAGLLDAHHLLPGLQLLQQGHSSRLDTPKFAEQTRAMWDYIIGKSFRQGVVCFFPHTAAFAPYDRKTVEKAVTCPSPRRTCKNRRRIMRPSFRTDTIPTLSGGVLTPRPFRPPDQPRTRRSPRRAHPDPPRELPSAPAGTPGRAPPRGQGTRP